MRRFRRFNHSTCKTVLNLLEAVYLDGYSGVVGYESFFIAIQFGLLSALFCCTRAVHYTQSVNQSNIASLRTADRHMCSLYGGTQRLSPQKLTPLFTKKLTPLFPHKPINSQALGGKSGVCFWGKIEYLGRWPLCTTVVHSVTGTRSALESLA